MNDLKNLIHEIAVSDYKHSDTKIEQKTRNMLRTKLLVALKETLEQEINAQDCEILLTEKGLTFVINNSGKIGMIPIELTPVFKNLDYDPYASAEAKAILVERALARENKRKEQAKINFKKQELAREKRAKIAKKVGANNIKRKN